jgi:hypothetical protein
MAYKMQIAKNCPVDADLPFEITIENKPHPVYRSRKKIHFKEFQLVLQDHLF